MNTGESIKGQKAACRKAAYTVRKAAHGLGEQAEANRRLLCHLRALACVDVISGYMPIRTEINPLPVMRALVEEGYRVCLPVVVGAGLPLVFRAWMPGCKMVEGAFGALVPEADMQLKPEALITPLLAFDQSGYRLGYGGGFYDRTLALLGQERRVYAIGFAYDAQRLESVPREATDQRLDAIITEKATY